MNESYKMVLLSYMLSRGRENWYLPVIAEDAAPFFLKYLTSRGYTNKELKDANLNKLKQQIEKMPMTYFRGKTEGIVNFENKVFSLSFDIIESANPIIYEWTKQVCEYRLHEHFERKIKK